VAPEAGGVRPVELQDLAGWPQGGIGVEQMIRQSLEQLGLVRPDAQMMELNLGVGPGEG